MVLVPYLPTALPYNRKELCWALRGASSASESWAGVL